MGGKFENTDARLSLISRHTLIPQILTIFGGIAVRIPSDDDQTKRISTCEIKGIEYTNVGFDFTVFAASGDVQYCLREEEKAVYECTAYY